MGRLLTPSTARTLSSPFSLPLHHHHHCALGDKGGLEVDNKDGIGGGEEAHAPECNLRRRRR